MCRNGSSDCGGAAPAMQSVSPILIAALRAGKTIRVFPHISGGGGGLDLAAGRLHLLHRLQPGGFVDGRAEVDEDAHLERVLTRVEGARPHAVVGGDAAHVDMVDALLLEDVEQPMPSWVEALEG